MKIKLDSGAFMPERAYETDAGLDIKAMEKVTIYGGQSKTLRTGVHVQLPKGTGGILISKSGLNSKYGITSTGLLDESYRGEIMITLCNNGQFSYTVEAGDKISQLVVVPVIREEIEIVDELDTGERGNNGFGSTGK